MKQNYKHTLYPYRTKSLGKIRKHDALNRQSIKTLTNFYNFYNRKSVSNVQQNQNLDANIKNVINQAQQNIDQIQNIQQNEQLNTFNTPSKNTVKILFPPNYQKKLNDLLNQLCLHFEIFQKMFKNSHRKKTSMSKLYGWDQQFGHVFFNGEEIFPNLSPNYIYKQLGLDRKTLKAKNMYNKLRLFTQQLISFNRKHQSLQCNFQGKRFVQSIEKLQKQIEKLKGGKNSEKYQDSLRRTKNQIVNMKVKIKNKGNQLEQINNKTGNVRINSYFYYQQRNLDNVQKLIRAKMF